MKTCIKLKGAEPASHQLFIGTERNHMIDLLYMLIEELHQKKVYYLSYKNEGIHKTKKEGILIIKEKEGWQREDTNFVRY